MSLTKPDIEGIIRANIWSAWAARREEPLDSGLSLMKMLAPGHKNIAKVMEITHEMQRELKDNGNLAGSYERVEEMDQNRFGNSQISSCALSENKR